MNRFRVIFEYEKLYTYDLSPIVYLKNNKNILHAYYRLSINNSKFIIM